MHSRQPVSGHALEKQCMPCAAAPPALALRGVAQGFRGERAVRVLGRQLAIRLHEQQALPGSTCSALPLFFMGRDIKCTTGPAKGKHAQPGAVL